MRTNYGTLVFTFAACLCATAPAIPAELQTLELDPATSRVEWTLDATLHTVHGTFQLKSGKISFSPGGGEAGGLIVIDAKSGSSGNGSRDSKMHSSVLESERYPDITFTPQRTEGPVAMTGTSQIQVHGVFRIHGQDHPIVLPVKVAVEKGNVKADAHLTVPYVSWGMKNPSTLFLKVADKMELEIHATGHIRQSQ